MLSLDSHYAVKWHGRGQKIRIVCLCVCKFRNEDTSQVQVESFLFITETDLVLRYLLANEAKHGGGGRARGTGAFRFDRSRVDQSKNFKKKKNRKISEKIGQIFSGCIHKSVYKRIRCHWACGLFGIFWCNQKVLDWWLLRFWGFPAIESCKRKRAKG